MDKLRAMYEHMVRIVAEVQHGSFPDFAANAEKYYHVGNFDRQGSPI